MSDPQSLKSIADAAIKPGYVASAAIFDRDQDSGAIRLAAAAGIAGPPLDALIAAVENPEHPIVKTLSDTDPTFDVKPMAAGGPALRSHLPLRVPGAPDSAALGVLAVAHEQSLNQSQRIELGDLASAAAAAIAAGKDQT